MAEQQKRVVTNAPGMDLSYRIIGLAMELHNELGPSGRQGRWGWYARFG